MSLPDRQITPPDDTRPIYSYFGCDCGKIFRWDENEMYCIDDDKDAMEIYEADICAVVRPCKCQECEQYEKENNL